MQNMSMFWRVLIYQITHHSVLQCVAVCCSVWQWVAMCGSLWQCVAVCCSALQRKLHVIVCCSVLQCVAVCCSVLQCVAVCCSAYYEHIWRMLIFRIVVAVFCIVLQCVCSVKREQLVWCVMHVTKKLLVSVLQCVSVLCVLQCQ